MKLPRHRLSDQSTVFHVDFEFKRTDKPSRSYWSVSLLFFILAALSLDDKQQVTWESISLFASSGRLTMRGVDSITAVCWVADAVSSSFPQKWTWKRSAATARRLNLLTVTWSALWWKWCSSSAVHYGSVGPLGPSAQSVNRKYPGPLTDLNTGPCGILGSVVDVLSCSSTDVEPAGPPAGVPLGGANEQPAGSVWAGEGCEGAWEQSGGGVLPDRELLSYRQEAPLPVSYGQETSQRGCAVSRTLGRSSGARSSSSTF